MRLKYSSLFVIWMLSQIIILKAQDHQLNVDAAELLAKIQPTMYGVFFEDINLAADGGLYPELVKNRSFEFDEPLMGWLQPNSKRYEFNPKSGWARIIKVEGEKTKNNFCRVEISEPDNYTLVNEGFRGMGIQKDALYRFSLLARTPNNVHGIVAQLVDTSGKVLGESRINNISAGWENYSTQLVANATEEKAQLKLTFLGKGIIDLDQISLFPADTWMGRENGLRKDLVQLLHDLDPGFLRFPGGCIVEGRTLAKRYQWKKTVGPLAGRELQINRWNTEFAHRPTPDYFQSFGLGFYEYFQLAEDLGAEPLPILGCGMACQFNTGELVPLDELDPYIQDALDLIEFANGNEDSRWGKIRADMGHPQPFEMKYIGIGNEQWGPEYIERYRLFAEAINKQYPDIILVSGAGPFPEGDFFEYGMAELKKLNADIIDEHYYRNPEWFRDNATRYDNYDRNGPKIFAGEYAAQSVQTVSPLNKNNWETALSEAAFMTGLERNADVVYLTSYAPLMAHSEGWQWTPDLIWFNNLEAYGTANYYVQKLFSNNRGTDLLRVTENNAPVTGQKSLYASAVLDAGKNELVIKLVNTSDKEKPISITVEGRVMQSTGSWHLLASEDLTAENSFEKPMSISPVQKSLMVDSGRLLLTLPPQSLSVLRTRLK